MNRQPIPCALCARFAVKRSTPPGHGHCDGWEKLRRYDDTNEACVLFNRAKDEARRMAWAEKQETISRASAPTEEAPQAARAAKAEAYTRS